MEGGSKIVVEGWGNVRVVWEAENHPIANRLDILDFERDQRRSSKRKVNALVQTKRSEQ